ncbi:Crp/Fnr family transcriptional regulator [Allomesorhizobium alhagi]|uniref:Crp/Fnr family transcriptional regulator n=1 Tax=Mesorhizobium alhagi CCNWXJ12-2 TaxID=1107882 RepID=H0I1S1_9HYPH|nr:Crp/Fnr family transcriptional regulator [Mesorhizobium alhagi]EHK53061.1 Crp/Fnr family transcriptional regulator [Mesorhizobium alhagi CCNWXJ12-2]
MRVNGSGTVNELAAGRRSAVFLSEELVGLDEGSSFLDRLSHEELALLRASGAATNLRRGEAIFHQGDSHNGIWLIESGVARTFYVGPSGREITLAFWSSGHFVGGPEVFGGGVHIWSADAHEDLRLRFLTGSRIRHLVETIPRFAVCMIDGLVAKGKCYSALVQMLGTRSVTKRLAHLLIVFADTHGRTEGNSLVIDKKITHDELANIVGSTRQWVTMTLDKFQKRGLITVSRQRIVVEQHDMLRGLAE